MTKGKTMKPLNHRLTGHITVNGKDQTITPHEGTLENLTQHITNHPAARSPKRSAKPGPNCTAQEVQDYANSLIPDAHIVIQSAECRPLSSIVENIHNEHGITGESIDQEQLDDIAAENDGFCANEDFDAFGEEYKHYSGVGESELLARWTNGDARLHAVEVCGYPRLENGEPEADSVTIRYSWTTNEHAENVIAGEGDAVELEAAVLKFFGNK